MNIELYQHLTGSQQKISDLLAMPGVEDIDIEIPRLRDLARPADFS